MQRHFEEGFGAVFEISLAFVHLCIQTHLREVVVVFHKGRNNLWLCVICVVALFDQLQSCLVQLRLLSFFLSLYLYF